MSQPLRRPTAKPNSCSIGCAEAFVLNCFRRYQYSNPTQNCVILFPKMNGLPCGGTSVLLLETRVGRPRFLGPAGSAMDRRLCGSLFGTSWPAFPCQLQVSYGRACGSKRKCVPLRRSSIKRTFRFRRSSSANSAFAETGLHNSGVQRARERVFTAIRVCYVARPLTPDVMPGNFLGGRASRDYFGLTGCRGILRIAVSGWRRSASDGSSPAISWRQT